MHIVTITILFIMGILVGAAGIFVFWAMVNRAWAKDSGNEAETQFHTTLILRALFIAIIAMVCAMALATTCQGQSNDASNCHAVNRT